MQTNEKSLSDYIIPENQRSRRKEWAIPLTIVIVAVLLMLFIGMVAWVCYYQFRFRGYVSNLSDSTVYAYNDSVLTVAYGDETYVIEGDGVYSFYTLVVGAGVGQMRWSIPEEDPEMTLDYGDGSYVQLWSTVMTSRNYGDMTGSIICYVNQEGTSFVYATKNIHVRNLNNILQRYLPDE